MERSRRRNKYQTSKIKPALPNGESFDSNKELYRYGELKLLESRGIISDLKRQVTYELIPSQKNSQGKVIERPCKYIADFVYRDQDGKTVVEDVKGFRTKDYVIKRKLMLYRYGIQIMET